MNSPLNSDNAVRGTVFSVQRYCTHDGPGIRTTVFLKGCPLRCIWCHNPESQSFLPEISYSSGNCLSCGACAAACKLGCHGFENGVHAFDRSACIGCGSCAEACPSALELTGREMTVDEALREVVRDKSFYGDTGGLTLSGGEPFAQPEFTLALLKKAKQEGIGTCVETCGFCKFEHLQAAVPYVDYFLYDFKETSPDKHKEFTGVDNSLIIDNLRRLDGLGARIILRTPIILGYNDGEEHLNGIAEIANSLKNLVRVEVEPGHTIGFEKLRRFGYSGGTCQFDAPDASTVSEWLSRIASKTSVQVKKA